MDQSARQEKMMTITSIPAATTAPELLARTLALVEGGVATGQAVAELLELKVSADTVREAQVDLLSGFARNPLVHPAGIHAGRLLWSLLDAVLETERTPSLAQAA